MNGIESRFGMVKPSSGDPESSGVPPESTSESVLPKDQPISETDTSVAYLGVVLEKSQRTSDYVPKREQYADYINDAWSLELQKKLAVSFSQGQPILVEGGTSIGKTTTVRKMCAELGWEVHYANLNGATDVEDLMGKYIPNPNKRSAKDSEYVFADGSVTRGLRQEEGKTKVIILDEFNAAAPNIVIRLHEVLDALERGGDVVLSEDAAEAVATNKEKTKVVALMNPPGKGYFAREPLDPAQLRRWVYQKEATHLPAKTFAHATDALFGIGATMEAVPDAAYLPTSKLTLTPEQLKEIPGLPEILANYREFHTAANKMLQARKLAADQPQPFTFDDRMEPRRVRDFIRQFYRGDINETFQQALQYYYVNKLESSQDKQKLAEIAAHVRYTPPEATKRRGLRQKQGTKIEPEVKSSDILLLNWEEELKTSKKFFADHNLPAFAESWPADLKLSGEAVRKIQEAREQGFDRMMVMPGIAIQQAHLDDAITALASEGYPNSAYVNPEAKTSTIAEDARSSDRPYLLLYSSQEVPLEHKNKSAQWLLEDSASPFVKQGWRGLTLPEYLVLQRKEFDHRGDHSFDAYNDDPEKSQWTWLLDSRFGSGRVVSAGWGPDVRQVYVSWSGRVYADPRLGARPAVVIPL